MISLSRVYFAEIVFRSQRVCIGKASSIWKYMLTKLISKLYNQCRCQVSACLLGFHTSITDLTDIIRSYVRIDYRNNSLYFRGEIHRCSKTLGGPWTTNSEGPPNQWVHFAWVPPGSTGPLDIVHPVHPLAMHLAGCNSAVESSPNVPVFCIIFPPRPNHCLTTDIPKVVVCNFLSVEKCI